MSKEKKPDADKGIAAIGQAAGAIPIWIAAIISALRPLETGLGNRRSISKPPLTVSLHTT